MLPVGWQQRFDGFVARERPLAPLTTWRIGGPAELYLEPASVEALSDIVAALWRVGLAYRILGGGSNLLVPDRGIRGVVVSLRRLDAIRARGDLLEVEAGAALHRVVHVAARLGLAGAEPLAGIPGHLGGAIFGNAGGRHGDIARLVRSIDVMERDGTLCEIVPAPTFFRYRGSDVGTRIVVRARLALARSSTADVRGRSLDIIRERRRSQPGWIGNAGCVFRNPTGHSAGRLIDEAGCKGLREGGVVVSQRHANFFENTGGGTAADVDRLVERVRDRVGAAFGIDLDVEVRRWDECAPS